MTPRQDAIALITASEDPLTMLDIWATRESPAFEVVAELASMARAAVRVYAEANGLQAWELMEKIGLREAGRA
jgi:hypothetical protein